MTFFFFSISSDKIGQFIRQINRFQFFFSYISNAYANCQSNECASIVWLLMLVCDLLWDLLVCWNKSFSSKSSRFDAWMSYNVPWLFRFWNLNTHNCHKLYHISWFRFFLSFHRVAFLGFYDCKTILCSSLNYYRFMVYYEGNFWSILRFKYRKALIKVRDAANQEFFRCNYL